MKEAIAEKKLREDLYYRLNVVPIFIPPLRERKEDILPLAEYFLEKTAAENHREKKILTAEARNKLLAYSWPGNVRELSNVIERAVVLDCGKQVAASHLFIETPSEQAHEESVDDSQKIPVGMTLQELEKRLIIETLLAQQNNKKKTAEVLGITPKILEGKISKLNL